MYTFTSKSGCIAVDCFFGVVLCILSLVNQVA